MLDGAYQNGEPRGQGEYMDRGKAGEDGEPPGGRRQLGRPVVTGPLKTTSPFW